MLLFDLGGSRKRIDLLEPVINQSITQQISILNRKKKKKKKKKKKQNKTKQNKTKTQRAPPGVPLAAKSPAAAAV
jgi:hypothetical protein